MAVFPCSHRNKRGEDKQSSHVLSSHRVWATRHSGGQAPLIINSADAAQHSAGNRDRRLPPCLQGHGSRLPPNYGAHGEASLDRLFPLVPSGPLNHGTPQAFPIDETGQGASKPAEQLGKLMRDLQFVTYNSQTVNSQITH